MLKCMKRLLHQNLICISWQFYDCVITIYNFHLTLSCPSIIMLIRHGWTETGSDGYSDRLKSNQCVYELWMKKHVPMYKMASISDFSEVRPDTFLYDLRTSVSIECGQLRLHFKEWFIVDRWLPQKLCRANKTCCYTVRWLWHYLRMAKNDNFHEIYME